MMSIFSKLQIDFPALLALDIFGLFAVLMIVAAWRNSLDEKMLQAMIAILMLMVGYYFGQASRPAAGTGTASLTRLVAYAGQELLGVRPAAAQDNAVLKGRAQPARPALTGNIGADIANAVQKKAAAASEDRAAQRKELFDSLARPFQDIAEFIGEDAEDAIALSTSIPGLQDGHGQQCWIAARNFIGVFKAHPLPLTGGAMRDLEALRLLTASAKQLCSDSHCNQVFTDFKQAALTIAQGVAGQIGAGVVRNIPTLQDLCTVIPSVPMAEPISPVPPPPDIKPVRGGGTAPANP